MYDDHCVQHCTRIMFIYFISGFFFGKGNFTAKYDVIDRKLQKKSNNEKRNTYTNLPSANS